MLKFMKISEIQPQYGKPFLARLNIKSLPYYVLVRDKDYDEYLEFSGERYMRVAESEIDSWLPLTELDKIPEESR